MQPSPKLDKPEQDPHDPRYRRILTGMTIVLALALVTAALWPPTQKPADTPPPTASIGTTPSPPTSTSPTDAPPVQPPGTPEAGPAGTSGSEAAPPPGDTGGTAPVPETLPAPAPKPLPDLPGSQPSLLVVNGDRSCNQIALTYDAGSEAAGAAAILDILKKYQITTTFFLTGKWAETYSDLAKRIAAEGHEIGNHTYSHPDLTTMQPGEVIAQIQKGEETIRRITGKDSRPLFREPYGAFNEAERRLVRTAGFSYSIYWDVDTLDWQFPGVPTLVERITTRAKNGSIVLMHMNSAETAAASDQAIPILLEKGYKLTTVSQLLQCNKSN